MYQVISGVSSQDMKIRFATSDSETQTSADPSLVQSQSNLESGQSEHHQSNQTIFHLDKYVSVRPSVCLSVCLPVCSGRWQAPAAVLPEGPKDTGDSHSRAREWPKHASPRARRARGRAKLSLRFGACQCYYMFFMIQPKIAIFMAQFKYLNDGQNA